jgi:hypothetical protein
MAGGYRNRGTRGVTAKVTYRDGQVGYRQFSSKNAAELMIGDTVWWECPDTGGIKTGIIDTVEVLED